MPSSALRVVPDAPPDPETALRELFQREADNAREAAAIATSIRRELRRLADERGETFIRIETARRELGGG